MDTGTSRLTAAEVDDILYKLGYDRGTKEFAVQRERRFVSAATEGGPADEYIDNPNLVLTPEDQQRIDAMQRGQRYLGTGGPVGNLPGQNGEELYGRDWNPERMAASR